MQQKLRVTVPRVSKQVFLPYGVTDLFDLVRDIRRYPEFVKWIRGMRVFDDVQTADVHTCIGEAEIGFGAFTVRFSTNVRSDLTNYRIEVGLVRGPFRHLENRWQFVPCHEGGTRVSFFIDYQFENKILDLLARANSRLAAERIMAAFRAEADRRFADRCERHLQGSRSG